MDAKFLFQPAIGHLPDTNRPTEIKAEKSDISNNIYPYTIYIKTLSSYI